MGSLVASLMILVSLWQVSFTGIPLVSSLRSWIGLTSLSLSWIRRILRLSVSRSVLRKPSSMSVSLVTPMLSVTLSSFFFVSTSGGFIMIHRLSIDGVTYSTDPNRKASEIPCVSIWYNVDSNTVSVRLDSGHSKLYHGFSWTADNTLKSRESDDFEDSESYWESRKHHKS